ncbi:hypothetical protein MMC07_005727 [Pseudocyphellaria aurata]|nr:hypothetical protein [Pseudocyphellaria aurata]
MHFRSLGSKPPSGATTALWLTTLMIATFFTRATVANPGLGPERQYSTLNVRENLGVSLGETIANGTRVNGARVNSTHVNSTHVNSISVSSQLKLASHHQRHPQPDTCLFYINGLYGPALYYAKQNNLTTIWDVYSGFDYGPGVTKSFTNAQHLEFYGKLARQYAQSCSGRGFVYWLGQQPPCNNSLFTTEEKVSFLQKQGNSLPLPWEAVDVKWHNWTQIYYNTHPSGNCSDTRRFTGTDPTYYWGN